METFDIGEQTSSYGQGKPETCKKGLLPFTASLFHGEKKNNL